MKDFKGWTGGDIASIFTVVRVAVNFEASSDSESLCGRGQKQGSWPTIQIISSEKKIKRGIKNHQKRTEFTPIPDREWARLRCKGERTYIVVSTTKYVLVNCNSGHNQSRRSSLAPLFLVGLMAKTG